MMAVNVNKLRVASEAPSLDLLMAWAILRPLPGKMGMLQTVCLDMGWGMWSPRYLPEIGASEEAMFPGYLFVRPPQGQRKVALRHVPFSGGPLEIVIFDRMRREIERNETARRLHMQAVADGQRSPRTRRVVRAFADLRELLGFDRSAKGVDVESTPAHIRNRIGRDSAYEVGLLQDYERTDEQAIEACADAEAIHKRKMYFQ